MAIIGFRRRKKGAKKHDSDQLANEDYKNGKKAGGTDGEKRYDSFLNLVCLH